VDIDIKKAKEIIVNDRPIPYKPDKQFLVKLGQMFPDINIFGFRPYYQGYWSIYAVSSFFPENIVFPQGATPFTETQKWAPQSNKP
jgi:hypothetical protein